MQNLIIIKLGGSVVTDKTKPFYAKERVIRRLGEEIDRARKEYKGNILIGHGSGSFGHVAASKHKTHKGLIGKKSLKGLIETSDAAIGFNRIVISNLIKVGLPVVSFAPSSFITAKNQRLRSIDIKPITKALDIGIVPVVFGDVVMDEKQGFCIFSTEKVLNNLAIGLSKTHRIEIIIHCTDTDGVYDSKGKTIRRKHKPHFT